VAITNDGMTVGSKTIRCSRAQSRRTALGRTERRRRHRVDRTIHHARERWPALSAGAKKVIISPGDRRRRHVRDRRQRRLLRPGSAPRRLQCLVHDELLRADGEGPRRRLRVTTGLMTTSTPTPTTRTCSTSSTRTCAGPRAAINIVPSSTGAARHESGAGFDEGRLDGTSLRVPVRSAASPIHGDRLVDERRRVNAAFRAAAEGPLKGVLVYTTIHRLFGHRRTRRRAPSTP